jgi:hypothetical protein
VTINVPNPEVLLAGLAHAELDLNAWDQRTWTDTEVGEHCGTTACLAGHILLSQGMSQAELSQLNEIRGAVPIAALQRLGFSVNVKPSSDPWAWDGFVSDGTNSFYARVFLHTRDDRLPNEFDEDPNGPLATHPEAFKYFKERITEVTGIEL